MDWIKVKVKHAEYDFEGASDAVFRTWVKLMTFVAFIERRPTKEQLEARLGKEALQSLEQHMLHSCYITYDVIIDKVLEDVAVIKHKREKGKERQAQYRHSNAPCNTLHNAPVTQADKIREDKRREESVPTAEELYLRHKEAQDLINKLSNKKTVA